MQATSLKDGLILVHRAALLEGLLKRPISGIFETLNYSRKLGYQICTPKLLGSQVFFFDFRLGKDVEAIVVSEYPCSVFSRFQFRFIESKGCIHMN